MARREALSLRGPSSSTVAHRDQRAPRLDASGIDRSHPVRVPGSCPLLEHFRWRVDYRVVPSTVIRGIGPRASPVVSITLGRSRRERLATSTFRLRLASARSHVGSRSIPLALRLPRSKQSEFLSCRGRLPSIRHNGTRAGSRVARGGRPQAAQRAYRWIFERASTCGLPRDGHRAGARWSRCATRRMGARRHLVAPHGGDRPRRPTLDENTST
jgi:hypothetical protein